MAPASRRGTLVPLYPTLSSQLAAIAREYGLPSTGGLVLYLLSTSDPSSSVPQPLPGSSGFAGEGGPRISEAAWSLLWSRLFEEEHEVYLVAEDALSDEDEFTPPVPPIPRTHQEQLDEDAHSRQPSDEQAIFSGDEDHERTSFSSDAGVDPEDEKPKSRRSSASAPRHAANGIGRGPPPSVPSPGARAPSRPSHRFSHSQQRYVSLPISANPANNMRHSSRNSMRSTRSGLPAYYYASPSAGRSVSHGSYATSHLSNAPAPGYGASVIVGKVEFDIDRSRAQGGKGKWYDAWIEGATIPSDPTEQQQATGGERWQELQLPELVRNKGVPPAPLPQTQAGTLGFSDSFAPERRAEQPRDADDVNTTIDDHEMEIDGRARTISSTSRGMESATSAWSLAAMAERVEQTQAKHTEDSPRAEEAETRALQEPEEVEDDSILDKEPVRSRPVSNASTALAESEKGAEVDAGEQGYSQLVEDDEESQHLEPASLSDSDESSAYGGQDRQVEEGDDIVHEQETEYASGKDPLGDVFESDEATWQALAADEAKPRFNEKDSVETTGLGIVGARINELAAVAPDGVLERLPEEQAATEQDELPPPEDDVGEVFSMLQSAQSAAASAGPLASPIRLDDSDSPPSHLAARDLAEREQPDSPFKMSHSANTSVSTVNFNVRPPSTIASMSPEYVPQRKQRQGWTNVPAVVEASISPSSSMGSIAVPDSQRASTIGLMENLDDLERALAELSPRANKLKPAAAGEQPESIPEEGSSPSFSTFAPPPRSSSREPQVDAGEASVEPESRHLSPSVASDERPGLSATSSFASEESFVTAVPPATDVSPVVEPVRIPRSSSLSKAKIEEQQPHLVALPPSPLPPSPSSMNSNEAADDHTPTVDSTNPEWSTLPPSPPRLPISLPESELPPVPPKVEEVAPFASTSPSTRSPGIKSLRMNKPWGSREGRNVKTQASPDPGSDDSPVPKSPLGSFFGKSTFGKAKGFFKKSECSSFSSSQVSLDAEPKFALLHSFYRWPALDHESVNIA